MSNTDDFAAGFRAFRAAREESVAASLGPLSPVGMAWLDEHPVTVDGAPGLWTWDNGRVTLTLRPGEHPTLDGTDLNPDDAEHTLTLPEVGAAGLWLADGENRIEVALRGDRPIVRPRHPGNTLRTGHTGVPTFPADPGWIRTGTYEAYGEPEQITVGSVLAGLEHHPTAVGRSASRRTARCTP